MHILTLTAEHCMALSDVEQIHTGFEMTPKMAVALEEAGGFAAVDGGDVLAIGGIACQWQGVGLAWAWLSRRWRRHARAITSAMCEVLDKSPMHRIEVGVRCDFERGHRWVKAMGFELETACARKWGGDGRDYSIYVRVN